MSQMLNAHEKDSELPETPTFGPAPISGLISTIDEILERTSIAKESNYRIGDHPSNSS